MSLTKRTKVIIVGFLIIIFIAIIVTIIILATRSKKTHTKTTPTTNSGTSSMPNSNTSSTPNSGTNSTPNSGTSSTPNSGTSSTPNSGTSSTPNSTQYLGPRVFKWINNNSIGGKCMSVSDGIQNNGRNGSALTLWDCPNYSSTDPNLQFQLIGNQVVWTNNGTIPNKCISVAGGIQNGGQDNTPITLWDCPNNSSTDPNLQFKLVGNQLVWTNNGTVPNKCVSVANGIQNGGQNNTPLKIWDCPNNSSSDPNLQFSF